MNEDNHLESAYEEANGCAADADYDDTEDEPEGEVVPCEHMLYAADRALGVPAEYCDAPSVPGEEFCMEHLDG